MRIVTIVATLISTAFAMPMQPCSQQPLQPSFRPEIFFLGRTTGSGTLKVIMAPRADVTVSGTGRMASDGTLDLVQVTSRIGKSAKIREWHLKATTAGHYVGSLTDATGAVVGDVRGDDFYVRYKIKTGIAVDQHLILQAGRSTISNRMVFRKLGIVVARMQETIRRSTPSAYNHSEVSGRLA